MQAWLEKPVFLSGATGFIGSNLYPKLINMGFNVRCGTHRPEKAASKEQNRDWVEFDVQRPETLGPALHECGAAFYLVHQMQTGEGYREREVEAARAFLKAAEAAGVHRIVYLGGVEPENNVSEHLASRLATGRILRSGGVSTVELRASMIIGSGSASWKIVRDLAARLPMMILPQWTQSYTQPVYIDDVVEALAGALILKLDGSADFDIPGPDTLSGEQILRQAAQVLGHDIITVPVPMLSPRLSSFWLKFVTRGDLYMARELVEGLKSDLLARDDRFWTMIGHPNRVSFKEAARRTAGESAPGSRISQAVEGLVRHISRPAQPSP